MLKPKIEKVVINISVGKAGEPLEKATIILKELTDQTPCKVKAKKTIREFGIRKGEPIACIVTLRHQKAIDFLKKVLPITNRIPKKSFDKAGNFSFGIKEHIEIPGVKYNPELGIFGMDVCVSIKRPGHHVGRKQEKSKIGSRHLLTREEAFLFTKDLFGIEIV